MKSDNNTHELYIVYKNDVASAISIQNSDLEDSIVDYLKIDNRHDIRRKGEIICTLAKKLESVEDSFKGNEFNTLWNDTTFLFNNIGARHNLDPNNKKNAIFLNLSDEEIERWYDHSFEMFLACIATLPYIGFKGEIKRFKRN